ncbi:uncharacterized protein SOCEGT47_022650 [Sorangium cellulosum]|uniref:Uncharacterized protein n=1 Tax=Sorangium cellulosum TaxID=56 RepID=A0A4P2PY47_SORCE|nr:uncharacterized protein SOCEGT47_022650 [Sorangium cellulosum]
MSLTFPTSGVTGFEVHQLDYRDALNELFELTLEVTSPDPEVDLSSVVGEEIVVALGAEPFLRRVRGIVRRVRQLSAEPTGVSRYELAVVPPLWLATRCIDNRIFQHLTADDVCKGDVDGHGARLRLQEAGRCARAAGGDLAGDVRPRGDAGMNDHEKTRNSREVLQHPELGAPAGGIPPPITRGIPPPPRAQRGQESRRAARSRAQPHRGEHGEYREGATLPDASSVARCCARWIGAPHASN